MCGQKWEVTLSLCPLIQPSLCTPWPVGCCPADLRCLWIGNKHSAGQGGDSSAVLESPLVLPTLWDQPSIPRGSPSLGQKSANSWWVWLFADLVGWRTGAEIALGCCSQTFRSQERLPGVWDGGEHPFQAPFLVPGGSGRIWVRSTVAGAGRWGSRVSGREQGAGGDSGIGAPTGASRGSPRCPQPLAPAQGCCSPRRPARAVTSCQRSSLRSHLITKAREPALLLLLQEVVSNGRPVVVTGIKNKSHLKRLNIDSAFCQWHQEVFSPTSEHRTVISDVDTT